MRQSIHSHQMLVGLAGVALLLAVSGCASPSPAPTASDQVSLSVSPSSTASPSPIASVVPSLILTTVQGWTFMRPSTWAVVEPRNVMIPGPIFFLTDALVWPTCPRDLLGWCAPVGGLAANGVLVTLDRGAGLRSDFPIRSFGKAPDGGCDEVLATSINGFTVHGCLRGPDLAPSEAAFKDVVASMFTMSSAHGWTTGRPSSWVVDEPSRLEAGSRCKSGTGMSCFPESALPRDGVLIMLSVGVVNPVESMALDATCHRLGGDEALNASINGYLITGCLRGPDLAPSEKALRVLVRSIPKVK